MKAGRSYFHSIARTVPRGAVVLRPQSGILQRWQSAASPWTAPGDSPRRDAAGRAGAPVMTESQASERPKSLSTPLRPGEAQGVPFSQSTPLMSGDSAKEKSAPNELAAPVSNASVRTTDSESAAHSPAGDPLARLAADGLSAASRVDPLLPALMPSRASTFAAEPSPNPAGFAAVDQAFANQAQHAVPRQPVANGEPAAPAKPAIHIGAIEIHVTPPPSPPHVTAARVAPRAVARNAPLSRGYLSRYGWDQA
jgi:hypothetical protein